MVMSTGTRFDLHCPRCGIAPHVRDNDYGSWTCSRCWRHNPDQLSWRELLGTALLVAIVGGLYWFSGWLCGRR